MLSDRSRNLIVGVTILAAMALFMFGIVMLDKVPGIGKAKQYKIIVIVPNANGVSGGANVFFAGTPAGVVKTVYPSRNAANEVVAIVELGIEDWIDIPTNATFSLERPLGVGSPFVDIKVAGAAANSLPKDNSATLANAGGASGGSNLLPPEILSAVNDVRDVVKNQFGPAAEQIKILARDKFGPAAEELTRLARDKIGPAADQLTAGVKDVGQVARDLHETVGDPQVQENFRFAMKNVADSSAQLKSVLSKVDVTIEGAQGAMISLQKAADQATSTLAATQQQIFNVAQKVVETLTTVQNTAKQFTEGTGTVAKLINDPRLYEGLLDVTKGLKTTASDLSFLVNKWADEGVNLKLK
jgi:ABC-type transporter Mla subunit MlaD